MNHQDALREMSVEKYLLGELTGGAREEFEEHLFDCGECTAGLKSSVLFAQAAGLELASDRVPARPREKSRSWTDWLLRPQWMAPALAACLLLLGYLSFFRVPELKQELAQAESPRVLNNLIFADGALRGGSLPHIAVPANGAVLLSVDLPQQAGYSSYVCSLLSPHGKLVWKESVVPSPNNETVQIGVPAAATEPGENTLLIQGVRQGTSAGATLDDLARHSFVLEFQE